MGSRVFGEGGPKEALVLSSPDPCLLHSPTHTPPGQLQRLEAPNPQGQGSGRSPAWVPAAAVAEQKHLSQGGSDQCPRPSFTLPSLRGPPGATPRAVSAAVTTTLHPPPSPLPRRLPQALGEGSSPAGRARPPRPSRPPGVGGATSPLPRRRPGAQLPSLLPLGCGSRLRRAGLGDAAEQGPGAARRR